jgi:hypothetical protein
MLQLSIVSGLVATLRDHLASARRDGGSVSVEQVIITAGLVTLTVTALAALAAGVAKYAGRI